MKELKAWIWVGCLFLGMTFTASRFEITQTSHSWLLLKKRIHSKYSLTVSEVVRKRYGVAQTFTERTHHDHHHNLSASPNQVGVPANETDVSKRSVKRGGVDYFENLTNRLEQSQSRKQSLEAHEKRKAPRTGDASNKNHPEYMRNVKMVSATMNGIGISRSGNRMLKQQKQIEKNGSLFIKEHLRDAGSWECNEHNRTECTWRRLKRPKRTSRYKRTVDEADRKPLKKKKERKQQIQEEGERRRKESATKREEARREKRKRTKAKRLKLKESNGRLHVTGRPSISDKMRENREKVRSTESKRLRSNSRNAQKSQNTGRTVNRKHVHSKHESSLKGKDRVCGKKCRKSLGRNDAPKVKQTNHKHATKGVAEKKVAESDEESGNKSDVERKGAKKKTKHLEPTSKEKQKPKGKKNQADEKKMDTEGQKKKMKSDNTRSRKSKVSHEGKTVSKSGSLESREEAGESGTEKTSRDAQHSSKKSRGKKKQNNKKTHKKSRPSEVVDESEHSSKKPQSEKKQNDKKTHQKGKPKSVDDQKKKGKEKGDDKDVPHKGKTEHEIKAKASKSKNRTSKKHVTVVSEDSGEGSNDRKTISAEHKHEKQKESKDSKKMERKHTKNGADSESKSTGKSANHKAVASEKKTKSVSTEKSATTSDQKPIANKENDSTGDRKSSDGTEYLSGVLGYGLSHRKQSHSKSQVWSRRVRKRPMTGGYASSGRLTRALSNLYGASASAGF